MMKSTRTAQGDFPSQSVDYSPVTDMIRELYPQIPQVVAIYQDVSEDVLRFWIFTSDEEYDRTLMGELSSRELEVRRAFDGQRFDFDYTPLVFIESVDKEVSSGATQIYQR